MRQTIQRRVRTVGLWCCLILALMAPALTNGCTAKPLLASVFILPGWHGG